MTGSLRTLRQRGFALLATAAASLLISIGAEASSYTLNFTGTANAPASIIGDRVSGTISIPDFNADTFVSSGDHPGYSSHTFQQDFSYVFHLTDPSGVGFDLSGALQFGEITSRSYASGMKELHINSVYGIAVLTLDLFTVGTGSPLTSLAGLPSTPGGIVAFLGGSSFLSHGTLSFLGQEIRFDLDVAKAPVPGALLLFATGLGGLGWIGWRRKPA